MPRKIKYELTMVAEARIVLSRATNDVRKTIASGEFVSENQRIALDEARRAWYSAIEAAIMVCDDDNGSAALLATMAPATEIIKAAKRIALGRQLNEDAVVATDPET